MNYFDFQGKKLSVLGMGCMRLPVIDKNDSRVDQSAVEKMFDYAYSHGVNYFDTAWGYHGGNSELAVGKALAKYPRESFYLADKFPGYDLNNMGRVEEIFEEQLKKCGVEYFDFYMFHNVSEHNIDGYMDPKNGILPYLKKQKQLGRIKHLGFSTHGTPDTMKRFLNFCGEDMEFCQIQLNWLDYHFQNAADKVQLLLKQNIPVWVMEPLRGGSLVNLKPEYLSRLEQLSDRTAAQWAFAFVRDLPGVGVVLSGMSDFAQLQQNIDTFAQEDSLSAHETGTLLAIAKEMTSEGTLPCTSCRYCTTHCPMELDIPRLIELYNEHIYSGGGFIAPMALSALDDSKKPSACLGCAACEAVCPQNIRISQMMSDFAEKIK